MNITTKLKLYSSVPRSKGQLSPLYPDVKPSRKSLLFGSFAFQEIAESAPGVWLYKQNISRFSLGQRELRDYFPLALSAILDLSLLPSSQDRFLHPEDVLFLDTETTGLSRGAGTFPFLLGLAYFKKKNLVIEQLYLESPAQAKEEALWNYFINIWRNFSYLVSYNASSFDLPLIQNRLRLNRKAELKPLLHFDLLHIFRRLFPLRSLPAYGQQDLEKELLKYFRQGDLKGSEIPQIYFDYVKYEHDGGMEKIIEHNQLDMLGMVFLFLEAIRVYEQRDGAQGALRSGLARILLRNRRTKEALELLRKLELSTEKTERSFRSDLRYRDLLLLAHLYRKEAKLENCIRVYQTLVREYQCVYSQMALAKLWEHHFKNYEAAIACVRDLRERMDPTKSLGAQNKLYTKAQLEHRLKRLRKKACFLS